MSTRTIHYLPLGQPGGWQTRRAHSEDLRAGLTVCVTRAGVEAAKDWFHASYDAQCDEFPTMFVAGELRGAPAAFFVVLEVDSDRASLETARKDAFLAMGMGLNVLVVPDLPDRSAWGRFLRVFGTMLSNMADSLVVLSPTDALCGRNATFVSDVVERLDLAAPVPTKNDVNSVAVEGIDTAAAGGGETGVLQPSADATAVTDPHHGSTRVDAAVASEDGRTIPEGEEVTTEKVHSPLQLPTTAVAGVVNIPSSRLSPRSNRAAKFSPRRLPGPVTRVGRGAAAKTVGGFARNVEANEARVADVEEAVRRGLWPVVKATAESAGTPSPNGAAVGAGEASESSSAAAHAHVAVRVGSA